jgi:hypothetical protein
MSITNDSGSRFRTVHHRSLSLHQTGMPRKFCVQLLMTVCRHTINVKLWIILHLTCNKLPLQALQQIILIQTLLHHPIPSDTTRNNMHPCKLILPSKFVYKWMVEPIVHSQINKSTFHATSLLKPIIFMVSQRMKLHCNAQEKIFTLAVRQWRYSLRTLLLQLCCSRNHHVTH